MPCSSSSRSPLFFSSSPAPTLPLSSPIPCSSSPLSLSLHSLSSFTTSPPLCSSSSSSPLLYSFSLSPISLLCPALLSSFSPHSPLSSPCSAPPLALLLSPDLLHTILPSRSKTVSPPLYDCWPINAPRPCYVGGSVKGYIRGFTLLGLQYCGGNMAGKRDFAADQMKRWQEERGGRKSDCLTTGGGNPICDKLNLLTIGPRGPLLVQDVVFTDEMAHFDRERIPERVVHAKGAGAFGYFEVTHDITKYSKAKVFEYIGKKTPIAVRFSTVAGESGSSDTVRDPRGFAVKMYTEDGNWDLTGNNTPIFFIRDAMLFPSFIHSQKRNPQTHMKDPDMVWDFWALRPESLHQVSFLFSDRGIPDGHRHMNGYGSHTFKLVNAKDEAVYCKFHYKTNQGIRNLTVEEANNLAATDPDYGIHDLYEAIATGNYPSWTFYIQVMTFEQAEKFCFNPFDLTKIWPHKEYPLIPVGKMVLNRNPVNYFAEVEQMAFDPSNMPPGIEPSPDKMLQGRLFSYPDTHRHRLGANYLQIPVNCPYKTRVANYQRDGPMCINDNQGGAPNYYPNSFSAPDCQPQAKEHKFHVSADVSRYNSLDEDNVTQVRDFYTKVLSEEQRQRLVENIAGHMKDAQLFIQKRAVKNFSDVHPEYGSRIQALLDKYNAEGTKKRAVRTYTQHSTDKSNL